MPNLVSLGSNMFNAYPHFMDFTVSNKFTVGGGSNAPATFTRNTYQYPTTSTWSGAVITLRSGWNLLTCRWRK